MSAADQIRALADEFAEATPVICRRIAFAAVNALPKVADLVAATADHRPTVAGYCVACVGGRRYDRCDIARARDALTAALGVSS